MSQVEARFDPLEIVLMSAQDGCTVCAEYTIAWKSFWAHPMVLLGDVCQVEALSICLEIVLISVLHGRLVCT
jgi:hypothetical protein